MNAGLLVGAFSVRFIAALGMFAAAALFALSLALFPPRWPPPGEQ